LVLWVNIVDCVNRYVFGMETDPGDLRTSVPAMENFAVRADKTSKNWQDCFRLLKLDMYLKYYSRECPMERYLLQHLSGQVAFYGLKKQDKFQNVLQVFDAVGDLDMMLELLHAQDTKLLERFDKFFPNVKCWIILMDFFIKSALQHNKSYAQMVNINTLRQGKPSPEDIVRFYVPAAKKAVGHVLRFCDDSLLPRLHTIQYQDEAVKLFGLISKFKVLKDHLQLRKYLKEVSFLNTFPELQQLKQEWEHEEQVHSEKEMMSLEEWAKEVAT